MTLPKTSAQAPASLLSRPRSITTMALIQFLKGTVMILVATYPLVGPAADLEHIPELSDVIFIASHGKDVRGILLLVLGVYATVLGLGLWKLKRWARNSLMATSGLMLFFWVIHLYFETPVLIMPAMSHVQQQTVYILLLLDLVIFLYLKFHRETYRSFPKKMTKKQQPALDYSGASTLPPGLSL